MATEAVVPQAIVMADFKGKVDPDWCPGCGDFGVLAGHEKRADSSRTATTATSISMSARSLTEYGKGRRETSKNQ